MLVPPLDHSLVQGLEAIHLALVNVFGNILGPEFEKYIHIFKVNFKEAMQTHNLKVIPKAHVLAYHIPEYVRRNGVPLEPTSEQALESQHTLFDIFCHRFEANYTKSPSFENVYLTLRIVGRG